MKDLVARGDFIPGGASQRGGVRPHQGSGFDSLGWAPSSPMGARRLPWGSARVRFSIVHQYGTIERSFESFQVSSGHIGFRLVSVGTLFWHNGSDWFPSEPCLGTIGADGARRIARLSRLICRPIWNTTEPRRAPMRPDRPNPNPSNHCRN